MDSKAVFSASIVVSGPQHALNIDNVIDFSQGFCMNGVVCAVYNGILQLAQHFLLNSAGISRKQDPYS